MAAVQAFKHIANIAIIALPGRFTANISAVRFLSCGLFFFAAWKLFNFTMCVRKRSARTLFGEAISVLLFAGDPSGSRARAS